MKEKTRKFLLSMVLFIVCMVFAGTAVYLKNAPSRALEKEAKPVQIVCVGGIMDKTGETSDVGSDYAMGMEEAFKYINEQGGINGKMVRYVWYDCEYHIPDAVEKYNLLKQLGAIAVMGWGTPDTEGLSPAVNSDKMPYVSASYSPHLTDPGKTPFNLFFAPDYSTSARACLTAWHDIRWAKHEDHGKRAPRLACVYMFSNPFCRAAVNAVKDQARLLGFEIGPDQNVLLTATDTKDRIADLKGFGPDVVWHGNTTKSVSVTLKDAYAASLGADWCINTWGFDENLPRLAGPAAEGAMGAAPCAFFGQAAPLMDEVMAYAKKYHPEVPLENRLIRTVQAWCGALLFREAAKRADAAGDLSGPGIKTKGFETLRGFDLGLGASKVSFTETDHRPTATAMVQEIRDGKFHELARVDLAARWPEKWRKEWMGW